MCFSGIEAPHLNFRNPSSLHFCDFSCGPYTPPNTPAAQGPPLLQQHHPNFCGSHRPPQWAPHFPPWFFGFTSLPPLCWNQDFELKLPGTHLKSPLTSVPFYVYKVDSQCLILAYWLIQEDFLLFSDLFMSILLI